VGVGGPVPMVNNLASSTGAHGMGLLVRVRARVRGEGPSEMEWGMERVDTTTFS
jgi:hypothetical protein